MIELNGLKGFSEAHTYKGGFEQWVYDEIKALRVAVGNIDGVDTSDIESAIDDLETTIGDNTAGLVKSVNDLETLVGDESTANSILGRIKALEDAG